MIVIHNKCYLGAIGRRRLDFLEQRDKEEPAVLPLDIAGVGRVSAILALGAETMTARTFATNW